MEFLGALFTGKPQNVLAVSGLFLVGYAALRFTTLGVGLEPGSLLVAAVAWAVYAAWEWLVLVRTPEANIRVDLLLIWPALAVLSAWSVYRALR